MEKDYAVAPGRILEEWLDENEMSQTELARRLGCSVKHVNRVVNGVASLTPTFAVDLERVTKVPARLWSNMESNYRTDLARLARESNEEEAKAFLALMPLTEMRKRGIVLSPNTAKKNLYAAFEEVLSFFQVGTVAAYQQVYGTPCAAYRQSGSHHQDPNALATWLRLGEVAAQGVEVDSYDASQLRAALPQLRALTTAENLTLAVAEAKRILAMAGVALLVIADVPGTRLYGATRWIKGHPVVQLSLRRRYDDHFWFTLFHELGHVLKHKHEDFIDYDGLTSPIEDEANAFAASLLVPDSMAWELPQLRSLAQVRDFAERAQVAPGVVLGRLQHDVKWWTHDKGYALKRKINPPLD